MFGYVKTDFPNMYVKDTVLYKAAYCGLCKGIAKNYGTKGRITLSYDLTFLSALLHNICNIDFNIKKEHCILHHFTKRPIASYDDLTGRVASLNIIFSYYKVADDIEDSKKGIIKKAFLKSVYKKAAKKEPEIDKIVSTNYEKLRKYEKQNLSSIDIVADCFGVMLSDVVKIVASNYFDENLKDLAYNLGKWIYLLDALDDFEKDIKRKEYNVFHNAYNDCKNKNELISKHSTEIIFCFGTMLNNITEKTKMLNYNFNHDLTDNILLLGLKNTLKQIMENKKCKKTSKF